MVFSEVDAAFSIWDRFRKWWERNDGLPVESVPARFVRLFESHGVHRNQIPRFFGHDLTVKDLQNDEALLLKLDEPILEAACDLFSIRREWLDGAESQIHPCYDFYKEPEKFSEFLDRLISNNPERQIQGVLIAPEDEDLHGEALLILQEPIDAIGEKPIYRYHLCHNWNFTYWKSRAYLTACIAISWKRNVYIHGVKKPSSLIRQLFEGNTLLGWQGEGIWVLGHTSWHPEDMTLEPDKFLNEINSERNNYGVKSALKLWLDLEQEGLMDAGFHKKTRPLFEAELMKYQE